MGPSAAPTGAGGCLQGILHACAPSLPRAPSHARLTAGPCRTRAGGLCLCRAGPTLAAHRLVLSTSFYPLVCAGLADPARAVLQDVTLLPDTTWFLGAPPGQEAAVLVVRAATAPRVTVVPLARLQKLCRKIGKGRLVAQELETTSHGVFTELRLWRP